MSPSTRWTASVGNYLNSVYENLHARSRTEAALVMVRLRLRIRPLDDT